MSFKKGSILGLIAMVLCIPLVTTNKYWLFVICVCYIYIILSLAMNIATGWTGQFALASAAFFGIGAYTAALLSMKVGFPFWLAIVTAMLAGLGSGFILGYPCLRVRHMYLAMVTIAFTIIVFEVLVNWVEVTGGPLGLLGIPKARLGFIDLSAEWAYYYFVFLVTLAVVGIMYRLRNSHIGRTLNAIRQDEEGAEMIGINATFYKVLAFSLTGMFSALSGGLYAFGLGFLSPETFNVGFSFLVLYMLLIGGIGSIEGAIIGGVVVGFFPEILRFVAQYKLVVFSAVIILILLYSPRGVSQLFAKR